MVDAFVKNKYYGNNLVKPEGILFDRKIHMKLSVIKSQVKDKNIVVRYEELKETIKARATALKQKHSFLLPFKTNRGLNKELEEISSEEHK